MTSYIWTVLVWVSIIQSWLLYSSHFMRCWFHLYIVISSIDDSNYAINHSQSYAFYESWKIDFLLKVSSWFAVFACIFSHNHSLQIWNHLLHDILMRDCWNFSFALNTFTSDIWWVVMIIFSSLLIIERKIHKLHATWLNLEIDEGMRWIMLRVW